MAEALQAQIALLQAQLEEVRLGQSEQFKQASKLESLKLSGQLTL